MKHKRLLTLLVISVMLLVSVYSVQSSAGQVSAASYEKQVVTQAAAQADEMSAEESKALVRRVQEEVVQGGNMELVDELTAADFVLHQPSGDQSREEYFGRELPALREAFPDLTFTFEDRIAEGNKVANRFTATGTHEAEFRGIPATGNEVTLMGIAFNRVEDDQLVETWLVTDRLGLVQQLGAVSIGEEESVSTATSAGTGADAPMEAGEMSAEESRALVRRIQEEVVHDGNMELVDELIAADYVLHQPSGDQGREAYFGQELPAFREAFPDLTFTFEDRIAEGNEVATRFTATGTHQAEFMGIPATGNEISVAGMVIDRVEDGQLVETWLVRDRLGLMQQLGVMSMGEEESGSAEESKALVRRIQEEVVHDGNMELVDELIAADYVLHQPSGDRDREAYFEQELPAFREAFPDLTFNFEDRIAEGNTVATRLTVTGTHQAEFMGIPATGNEISVAGIVFDRVEDGQLVETWLVRDRLGLMQQLGVAPTE